MNIEIHMELANHIAEVCGLPGLFIGTYGDIIIDYIWYGNYEPFSRLLRQDLPIIVIKSNHWVRAVVLQGESKSRDIVIVDIDNWDDPIIDFVKQHDRVQTEEEENLNRMYPDKIYVRYITPEKDNRYYAGDTEYHTDNVKDLRDRFLQAKSSLEDLLNAGKLNEVSRIPYDDLTPRLISPPPERHIFHARLLPRYINFSELMMLAHSLELSGLFHQADSPHDLEYIIKICRSDSGLDQFGRPEIIDADFVLVRTKQRTVGGQYTLNAKNIVWWMDMPHNDLDWESMLDQMTGMNKLANNIERFIYGFYLLDGTKQFYNEYDLANKSPELLEIWKHIDPYIQLLEANKVILKQPKHRRYLPIHPDEVTRPTLIDNVRAFVSRWRNRDSSPRR